MWTQVRPVRGRPVNDQQAGGEPRQLGSSAPTAAQLGAARVKNGTIIKFMCWDEGQGNAGRSAADQLLTSLLLLGRSGGQPARRNQGGQLEPSLLDCLLFCINACGAGRRPTRREGGIQRRVQQQRRESLPACIIYPRQVHSSADPPTRPAVAALPPSSSLRSSSISENRVEQRLIDKHCATRRPPAGGAACRPVSFTNKASAVSPRDPTRRLGACWCCAPRAALALPLRTDNDPPDQNSRQRPPSPTTRSCPPAKHSPPSGAAPPPP